MAERNIAISLPSTGDDEWNADRVPLISGWLTQESIVAEFEQKLTSIHPANHALVTNSYTTGKHLMLAALCVGTNKFLNERGTTNNSVSVPLQKRMMIDDYVDVVRILKAL